MRHWRPAHQSHAIERVLLTLRFSEALPSKIWQALLSSASLRIPANGFDSAVENKGPPNILIQAGMIGAPFQIGNQTFELPTIGKSFQRLTPTGVTEQLILNNNHFSYQTSSYDSWKLYLGRFLDNVGESLDMAISVVNIESIKLEYWDRFVHDSSDPVTYDALVRVDSPLIAQSPIKQHDLWHSHVGFYAQASKGTKRLVNVNVDAIDTSEAVNNDAAVPTFDRKRSVGIYTMVQDSIAVDVAPQNRDRLVSIFDELHTILKATLSEVITPEACERISLHAVGEP